MTRNQTAQARPAIGSRFRHLVALWRARASERRALAMITERDLRDIGLSPGEAIDATSKPFWTA